MGQRTVVLCYRPILLITIQLSSINISSALLSFFWFIPFLSNYSAQRHHSAIFFGIFFGVADYIYTAFQPSATLNGIEAMSKGSALASMIWVAIIVYTTDRRWIKAAIFCVTAAFFAGCGKLGRKGCGLYYPDLFSLSKPNNLLLASIHFSAHLTGIIHQPSAFENFTTGFQGMPNSSPAQFMAGYLSMAAVSGIMWL